MALTDTAIKKAQTTGKLQKLSDGSGLQLHIAPTGGKLWRWAYRFDGKQKTMAFGVYPAVSLAQARERRIEAAKVLARGIDPMAHKKAVKLAQQAAAEHSFESVARQWFEHWKGAKNARHANYVMARLEADVLLPHVGAAGSIRPRAAEEVLPRPRRQRVDLTENRFALRRPAGGGRMRIIERDDAARPAGVARERACQRRETCRGRREP